MLFELCLYQSFLFKRCFVLESEYDKKEELKYFYLGYFFM